MGFSVETKESRFENPFRINIFKFLETYNPDRLKMLKRLLSKIGFRFKGILLADLFMPMNVGGYYYDAGEVIAINPALLLYGSEKDIAHVLVHEGIHAGIYTDQKVDDEALVESMTKQKMIDIYGGKKMKSGYDGLVDKFAETFGDMSFDEMSELINDENDETLNSFLEVVVVDSSIENGIEDLSWEEIKKKLSGMWGTLQKLFPRLMNSVGRKTNDLHAEAQLSFKEFKLESLLQKTAQRIISEQPTIIYDLLEEITEVFTNKEVLSEDFEDTLIAMIYSSGYGYLIDFDDVAVRKIVTSFALIKQLEIKNEVMGVSSLPIVASY